MIPRHSYVTICPHQTHCISTSWSSLPTAKHFITRPARCTISTNSTSSLCFVIVAAAPADRGSSYPAATRGCGNGCQALSFTWVSFHLSLVFSFSWGCRVTCDYHCLKWVEVLLWLPWPALGLREGWSIASWSSFKWPWRKMSDKS